MAAQMEDHIVGAVVLIILIVLVIWLITKLCTGSTKEKKHYVYHYTSQKGLDGILSDRVIRPSENTTRDAVLGIGVYLTQRPPETSTEELLANNYDGRFSNKRRENVECYLRFESDRIPGLMCVNRGGRHICCVPGSIYIDSVPFTTGHRY